MKAHGGKTIFHAGETHYASTDFLRDSQPDIENYQIKLFSGVFEKLIKSKSLLFVISLEDIWE